jgi:hypothetical protein
MKKLLAALAVTAALEAQGAQTFVGSISDDMCAKADHSQMQMGPTDADCTTACVSAHGASYVLYDGKAAYKLSSRQSLEKFAGRKVRVGGTLDAKTQTIRVNTIVPAR